MKKPINVDKIGGKKLFITASGRSYVFLITEGINDKDDETNLFINPIELYDAGTMSISANLWDGPFLRSDLEKVTTEDKSYEFSLIGRSVPGMVDWEQTHVIVVHINWPNQLMTATLAAVGDGVKGTKLIEQYKFNITDASSLNNFVKEALAPYLNYFISVFPKMTDTTSARIIQTATLKQPVTV